MISQQTDEASPTISGSVRISGSKIFEQPNIARNRYLRVSPASVHPVTERQPDLWM